MRVNFKKVILHNFLSYAHSEFTLTDKGTCLVEGTNNCKKDNAKSNGSGKSTFISAICYALTGETIQGVKNDLKNIYIDEDLCYVTLLFSVDDKEFEITRFHKPKSDLKIKVNGEDVSGKGIKESELILGNYIPDLNKNLLTSVILLGQGLPNKLSAHTPSGRKEMLENLSKSDFMIEDIKRRLSARQEELKNNKLENNNLILKDTTLLSTTKTQLEEVNNKLIELSKQVDLDSEINSLKEDYNNKKNTFNNIDNLSKELKDKIEAIEKSEKEFENKEFTKLTNLSEELQTSINNQSEQVYSTRAKINALDSEIKRLESIKDICPTCGQKIPGAVKQDTTKQHAELDAFKESLKELTNKQLELNSKKISLKENYNKAIKENKDANKDLVNLQKRNYNDYMNQLDKLESEMTSLNKQIIYKETLKETLNKQLEEYKNKESVLKIKESDLTKELEKLNTASLDLDSHLDVLKKMDTLVKRDFRGYLLSNIIEYINSKAKEYCSSVFETNDIEFKLDGNNIAIEYAGKQFDGLSGGEKQKVDLILQFAIRDMMSKYLDFSSNILCLDEIFDNLDYQATQAVLNLINSKITDVESMFIISHHSDELSISCDSTIKIIKNEEGISSIC